MHWHQENFRSTVPEDRESRSTVERCHRWTWGTTWIFLWCTDFWPPKDALTFEKIVDLFNGGSRIKVRIVHGGATWSRLACYCEYWMLIREGFNVEPVGSLVPCPLDSLLNVNHRAEKRPSLSLFHLSLAVQCPTRACAAIDSACSRRNTQDYNDALSCATLRGNRPKSCEISDCRRYEDVADKNPNGLGYQLISVGSIANFTFQGSFDLLQDFIWYDW